MHLLQLTRLDIDCYKEDLLTESTGNRFPQALIIVACKKKDLGLKPESWSTGAGKLHDFL